MTIERHERVTATTKREALRSSSGRLRELWGRDELTNRKGIRERQQWRGLREVQRRRREKVRRRSSGDGDEERA